LGLSLLLHGVFFLGMEWIHEKSSLKIGISPIQVNVWGFEEGNAKSNKQTKALNQRKTQERRASPIDVASTDSKDKNTYAGQKGGSVASNSDDATLMADAKPHYPQRSRALGEEGEVSLQVIIVEDGSVGDVVLKRSSGYFRLDQSAITFLKGVRFRLNSPLKEPLVKNISIVFRLND